ncbi:lipopolysaccharide assembly protein LapA domain-containing protein [Pseudomonas mosselii]|uniref:lipopolysaccharide assembly protein LapA domain-containing protein n=1 Tax=Pseudomonas mosselii TaxID=78327 RepID=UPI00244C37B4|nr:lipopolysaccharide assembly protein LapA domain-containing protein [Pseudomonas mosselii]MDH0629778.1 lipopolysaccharide assembly protein LapA domain-containing protein [Pseudomonas mosselii]MDH0678882.1 lipopolysaccharide assembly protein LapA domain-containing protein [Pseudomonas mosselii]MDH0927664.1 lipopolysaccharide assembly protein LapA domain-containing protein [Pseudomonas mosselii]MDH1135755.1 lipopolysaccharide assembly protein LapA domain-containing protein [Pseudomonas mosselii
MRNLKRALAALFVLLLAAVVLLFVLENQQAVSLVLLGWSAPSVPVAVLVLVALVIGLAVGPMLGAYSVAQGRRRLRQRGRKSVSTEA